MDNSSNEENENPPPQQIDDNRLNDDSAKEIIEMEFLELKEWMKGEIKKLKRDYVKKIDMIQVKVDYME
jgi:hypothetical protein